jgi:hypothetical protein
MANAIEPVRFENEKVRIFRGDATRQLDASGPVGRPADPEKYYYEPADYDGDTLWGRGYYSYAEAYHAAGCSQE